MEKWSGPFSLVPCVRKVNVNTTDATTGATALLLPAQNTHTLHDPIMTPYADTEHARAGKFSVFFMCPHAEGWGRRGRVLTNLTPVLAVAMPRPLARAERGPGGRVSVPHRATSEKSVKPVKPRIIDYCRRVETLL